MQFHLGSGSDLHKLIHDRVSLTTLLRRLG